MSRTFRTKILLTRFFFLIDAGKIKEHVLEFIYIEQCFPIFFWLAPPILTTKFLSPPYQWRAEVW